MLIARLRSAFRSTGTLLLIVLPLVLIRNDAGDVSRVQTDLLLKEISDGHFLAGGRLTSMPYPGKQPRNRRPPALLKTVLSDSTAMSLVQRRVLALVYVVDGDLVHARSLLSALSEEMPTDAGIHNDLGVLYMGLASSDLLNWFNAIREFNLAVKLQPEFPEARFNLILT
ncbi:MAG TPA: hypothetical protein VFC63_10860, partial [Blastocatellia bacterium]|nr:hypothetical protein [Blastocatellia bacterium]